MEKNRVELTKITSIKGVKKPVEWPLKISPLMYVGYLFLFCRAKFSALSTLERYLMTFCE